MGHSYQIYALCDNHIVHIDDVESGLKCNCICPACEEHLIARKGAKRMHHFAHQSSSFCEYGYESSLHLAAKEILSTMKALTLPSLNALFPNSLQIDDPMLVSKSIEIDHIELEKQFGSIIPDIVVYSGGKKLFVEIYVTHKIDEEKKKKIQEVGISTLEIDLSAVDDTISKEKLSSLLHNNCPEKKWIYNAWAEKYLQKLYTYSEKKPIISRRGARHVDDCPLHVRDFKGKSYANFIDDCQGCIFCFGVNDGMAFCSGQSMVASVSDMILTLEERKEKYSHMDLFDIRNTFVPIEIEGETAPLESYIEATYSAPVFDQQAIEYADFDKPEPVIDSNGWRWLQCVECGAILRNDKMHTKGSPGNLNKGICRDCYKKRK